MYSAAGCCQQHAQTNQEMRTGVVQKNQEMRTEVVQTNNTSTTEYKQIIQRPVVIVHTYD